MTVVLVHHADAVGADIDPQRPLSTLGLAQAEQMAARARDAAVKPAIIWHSGKLRARQTAEAFLRLCHPFADFKMVRGLRPEDPPAIARAAIDLEDRDLLLVSHMPILPALARMLTPGADEFPLNGLIVLERDSNGGYVERWRAAPDI